MKDRIQFSELTEQSPKAIQKLYHNNFPLILEFITQNNGTMNEARDIFHDAVFVLIQRIRENVVPENSDLKTYIYSISRILWNDLMREKRMDQSNVRHIHEYQELDQLRISTRLAEVKNLSTRLKTLPEPGRTIVREHYANNIALSEIALRMGFSVEESAKKGKLKALKKLLEDY